jgi:hypothetical protein
MKEEKIIRKLATRAKAEDPPRVDVTQQVMETLYARAKVDTFELKPLVWVMGFSSSTATLISVWSVASWQAITDPLLRIIFELSWGIL